MSPRRERTHCPSCDRTTATSNGMCLNCAALKPGAEVSGISPTERRMPWRHSDTFPQSSWTVWAALGSVVLVLVIVLAVIGELLVLAGMILVVLLLLGAGSWLTEL